MKYLNKDLLKILHKKVLTDQDILVSPKVKGINAKLKLILLVGQITLSFNSLENLVTCTVLIVKNAILQKIRKLCKKSLLIELKCIFNFEKKQLMIYDTKGLSGNLKERLFICSQIVEYLNRDNCINALPKISVKHNYSIRYLSKITRPLSFPLGIIFICDNQPICKWLKKEYSSIKVWWEQSQNNIYSEDNCYLGNLRTNDITQLKYQKIVRVKKKNNRYYYLEDCPDKIKADFYQEIIDKEEIPLEVLPGTLFGNSIYFLLHSYQLQVNDYFNYGLSAMQNYVLSQHLNSNKMWMHLGPNYHIYDMAIRYSFSKAYFYHLDDTLHLKMMRKIPNSNIRRINCVDNLENKIDILTLFILKNNINTKLFQTIERVLADKGIISVIFLDSEINPSLSNLKRSTLIKEFEIRNYILKQYNYLFPLEAASSLDNKLEALDWLCFQKFIPKSRYLYKTLEIGPIYDTISNYLCRFDLRNLEKAFPSISWHQLQN